MIKRSTIINPTRTETVLVKISPETRFSMELVRAKSGKTLSSLGASAISFIVGGAFMDETKVLEIVNKTWHPKKKTRIKNIKKHYPKLFTKDQLEKL